MRRPGVLLAGLLLATGAGLALSSPAAAAPAGPGVDGPRWHCHWSSGHNWYDDDWDDGDHWSDHRRRYCHRHRHGQWHGGHVIVGNGGVFVGGGGHH